MGSCLRPLQKRNSFSYLSLTKQRGKKEKTRRERERRRRISAPSLPTPNLLAVFSAHSLRCPGPRLERAILTLEDSRNNDTKTPTVLCKEAELGSPFCLLYLKLN